MFYNVSKMRHGIAIENFYAVAYYCLIRVISSGIARVHFIGGHTGHLLFLGEHT